MKFEELKVKDVMTAKVMSANKDMPVTKLIEYICQNHLHTVPIVDENENVLGVVSIRDILKVIMTKHLAQVSSLVSQSENVEQLGDSIDLTPADIDNDILIESILKRNIISTEEESLVSDVAVTMFSKGLHRIPVVKDKKLIGIISQSDILKVLAKYK